jgi:hypothetical protein
MNHYQEGFLAGLSNKAADTNPLLALYNDFIAGENAKKENKQFCESAWRELSLTTREGFKSSSFAHLYSKGAILKRGYNDWQLGYKSGLNKYNNVLADDVHSVAFSISVEMNAATKGMYAPFIQHYTFLDHRNEVYRIEARHRHGLTSVYPNEHVINKTPCLPDQLTINDIGAELNKEVLIGVHDILQSAARGYQPIVIKGLHFLSKNFHVYSKLLLDIPQWNAEASALVDWELKLPKFS